MKSGNGRAVGCLTNDLIIPFSLNNFDGNVRNCFVGHCMMFYVDNDLVSVYDNCCSKISLWYICSRYVATQEKITNNKNNEKCIDS